MATRPNGILTVKFIGEQALLIEEVPIYINEDYEVVMRKRAQEIIRDGYYKEMINSRYYYSPYQIRMVTWEAEDTAQKQ